MIIIIQTTEISIVGVKWMAQTLARTRVVLEILVAVTQAFVVWKNISWTT